MDKQVEFSKQFKLAATWALLSVALFVAVYILLVIVVIGVAIAVGALGVLLFAGAPSGITIGLMIGALINSVFIAYFMFKFIFSGRRKGAYKGIEITRQQQPRLFDFVEAITKQAGVPFPKKIYISDWVNASASYNSPFLSMFFPVRKNLEIGLGLVNVTNVSELEATIAHEFGHFSQPTMRIGSYVYASNKVFYNLLFDNVAFNNSLGKVGSKHLYIYIFALITRGVITAAQEVLKLFYKLVNMRYMALSRQMEFHADAIAASVAGGANVTQGLRNISAGSAVYGSTLQFCNHLAASGYRVENVYQGMQIIMTQFAVDNGLQCNNGIPVLTDEMITGGVKYTNQWQSHPSQYDREKNVAQYNFVKTTDERSAWVLFDNALEMQLQATAKLYTNNEANSKLQVLNTEQFALKYTEEHKANSFNPVFKSYYDFRNIDLDAETPADIDGAPATTLNDILNAEAFARVKKMKDEAQNIAVVEQISNGHIETRTFDYNGKRYKKEDAAALLKQMSAENENRYADIKNTDALLYAIALGRGNSQQQAKLRNNFNQYRKSVKAFDEYNRLYNACMQMLFPVFNGQVMPHKVINKLFSEFRSTHEPALKKVAADNLAAGLYKLPWIKDKELAEIAREFASSSNAYFDGKRFWDKQLRVLHRFLTGHYTTSQLLVFNSKKDFLDLQAQLLLANKNAELV